MQYNSGVICNIILVDSFFFFCRCMTMAHVAPLKPYIRNECTAMNSKYQQSMNTGQKVLEGMNHSINYSSIPKMPLTAVLVSLALRKREGGGEE